MKVYFRTTTLRTPTMPRNGFPSRSNRDAEICTSALAEYKLLRMNTPGPPRHGYDMHGVERVRETTGDQNMQKRRKKFECRIYLDDTQTKETRVTSSCPCKIADCCHPAAPRHSTDLHAEWAASPKCEHREQHRSLMLR